MFIYLPVATAVIALWASTRRCTPPRASCAAAPTHDYHCVANGQVFVATSWLDADLLTALRNDLESLQAEGRFINYDDERSVAGLHDAHFSSVMGQNLPNEARAAVSQKLENLRVELEQVMDRRLFLHGPNSMVKYSISRPGQPLGWHTDQVHEALGSGRAYRTNHGERTRRSLAWLLYLSDGEWGGPSSSGRGGTLRAYPRGDATGKCGAHHGNLQVGWLERGRGSEAVFLDSWAPPREMKCQTLAGVRRSWQDDERFTDRAEISEALRKIQPGYQLYCVVGDDQRENLSDIHERPPKDDDGAFRWRLPLLNEMLPKELRAGFSSLTIRELRKHEVVEVIPRGGTLVLFDAVCVPHEVLAVEAGMRYYLGGFFAEERLPPAAWVDSDVAESSHQRWVCDSHPGIPLASE